MPLLLSGERGTVQARQTKLDFGRYGFARSKDRQQPVPVATYFYLPPLVNSPLYIAIGKFGNNCLVPIDSNVMLYISTLLVLQLRE